MTTLRQRIEEIERLFRKRDALENPLSVEDVDNDIDDALRRLHNPLVAALKEMEGALKTSMQALAEMDHAHNEPGWFTKGAEGADAQFRLWRGKGVDAVKAALALLDKDL